MAKIIQLPPTGAARTPIGHAIRTGEASYKRLENLHAEGRLPARAVIVDASKARFQKEFIRALRATGADVTLDPKVAELSEVGKFSGSARETPWAVDDNTRPLEAEDFEPGANADLFGKFARMAAELGVTSVMAPTHLLRSGVDNLRLPIDCRSVGVLRAALDREAGRHVAIDALYAVPDTRRIYHFINVELRDAERLARDLVHLNVDDGRLNKALSNWRKRIDSMTRMFETLSERPRPSPPPLRRRQGPGAPTHRSSA